MTVWRVEDVHLHLTSLERQLVELQKHFDKTKLKIMVDIRALRHQMLEMCLGTVCDLAQQALREAESNEASHIERVKLRQIRQRVQEPQQSTCTPHVKASCHGFFLTCPCLEYIGEAARSTAACSARERVLAELLQHQCSRLQPLSESQTGVQPKKR